LQAQSPVGQPEVSPKFIELSKATKVTVKSRIDDAGLIKSSVMVQRYDQDNSMWVDVGMMNDDGAAGDLKKDDKVFTWQGDLTVTDKPNPVLLRVVAKLNGMKNVESSKVPLTGVKSLLKDYDPDKMQNFLNDNKDVRSAAAFLQRLNPDDGFKHDWVLITRTVSAQKADAAHPRIILQNSGNSTPGSGSTAVFGVGTLQNQNLIEYMQWDGKNRRFRFHEVDTTNGKVRQNVESCNRCHGPQLEGKDWPYPRPNWDAYDSWGGALPFNRDRLYIARTANAIEPRAMQRLLKDLAADPVVSQIDLPEGISGADDSGVIITPDPVMDGSPAKLGKDENTAVLTVQYQKEEDDGGALTGILFPGNKSSKIDVQQGGPYLVMHHLGKGLTSDEGRGVALFDNFSALNAQRVAQELNDKFDKEGVQYVDLRPVALAIAGGGTDGPCDVASNLDKWGGDALPALMDYFKVTKFQDLLDGTHKLRASLPQIKAQQEGKNLIGLMSKNGDAVTDDAVLHQVAQRSVYGPPSQVDDFILDELTGFMIDREIYGNIDKRIALFRLFLEPSHEPVSLWSLSLFSTKLAKDHSDTHTFGDVFETGLFKNYVVNIRETLNEATFGAPDKSDLGKGKDKSCAVLQKDSKAWFDLAIKDHPDYFKK
jgi:hypothetical protein